MTIKRCSSAPQMLEMKRAETVLAHRSGSNHSDPDKEDRAMAAASQYGDSKPKDNTGNPDSTCGGAA